MIEDYLRPGFISYGTSLGAKAGVVLAAAYPIAVVSIFLLLDWASGQWTPSIGPLPTLLELLTACFYLLWVFLWYLIFIGIPSSIVGGVGGWTISRILLHTQRYFSRKYAVAVGITVGFLAAVIYHQAWLLVDIEPAWLVLARGEHPRWDIEYLIDIPSLIAILAGGWGGGKLYDEFVGTRAVSNVQ